MAYNGWKNWQTWQVPLWLNNDEPMYRITRDFMRRTPTFTAANVKEFVLTLMPNGTPDFKSPTEYDQVDWAEIAENWNDEKRTEGD